MRLLTVAMIALPLLAGCGKSDADKTDGVERKISIEGEKAAAALGGEGIKIDTDGFKASLEIPGMDMGGKAFNIDDMTLLPGSKVRGMKIAKNDKDDIKDVAVTISFISPGTPAAVLDHAEAQAKGRGWTVARSTDGVGGTKGGQTLAYKVVAAGPDTAGTVVIAGDE